MVYRDVYGYSNTTSTYNATDGSDIWGISRAGDIKTLNSTENNTFVSPTTFQGAPTDATQKAASAAANWSMLIGSPAVDSGTDLSGLGITTDILGTLRPLGTAWDRGAYERSGTPTAIDAPTSSTQCFSSNQSIEVRGLRNGQNVSVYGIAGNLVSNVNATASDISIAVHRGVYIVRISNSVNKLVVR